MKLHLRYIGEALVQWNASGAHPSAISAAVDPMAFMVGDYLSHPDFPGRWLSVALRHIDLSEPAVTLFLDLLPAHQSPPDFPENVLRLVRKTQT